MLVLERTYLDDRTAGKLWVYHERVFDTIELPWRGNQLRVSCIPEGRYTLLRDLTGRHKWFRIRDVQVNPRSAIEVHPARRPDQLLGCIGMSLEACRELLGMCPAGDTLWIRSDGGEPPFHDEGD